MQIRTSSQHSSGARTTLSRPRSSSAPRTAANSGRRAVSRQCGESIFAHWPRLRVVRPSTAIDANAPAHRAAQRGPRAVALAQTPCPGSPTPSRVSRPAIHGASARPVLVREGSDSRSSPRRGRAARLPRGQEAQSRGSRPRSWTCGRSSRSTSRRSQASVRRRTRRRGHEDTMFCGSAPQIAARVAGRVLHGPRRPIKRVAAVDCYVSYAPTSEEHSCRRRTDCSRRSGRWRSTELGLAHRGRPPAPRAVPRRARPGIAPERLIVGA